MGWLRGTCGSAYDLGGFRVDYLLIMMTSPH